MKDTPIIMWQGEPGSLGEPNLHFLVKIPCYTTLKVTYPPENRPLFQGVIPIGNPAFFRSLSGRVIFQRNNTLASSTYILPWSWRSGPNSWPGPRVGSNNFFGGDLKKQQRKKQTPLNKHTNWSMVFAVLFAGLFDCLFVCLFVGLFAWLFFDLNGFFGR